MSGTLQGKRILVTQADTFMGPMLCEVFAEHGAEVVASTASLSAAGAAEGVVGSAGELDALVANLALAAPITPAVEVTDGEWRQTFAALVDPLPRLVRAVVPGMKTRGHGKILVVDNPTYFPEDVQRSPRFQERLKREVPLGRLVSAREDAQFAAYLCSDAADCFVGQVFPVSGGWAIR
jgi:2-keto-3-deoxy-L-fuconate dehydrogenase